MRSRPAAIAAVLAMALSCAAGAGAAAPDDKSPKWDGSRRQPHPQDPAQGRVRPGGRPVRILSSAVLGPVHLRALPRLRHGPEGAPLQRGPNGRSPRPPGRAMDLGGRGDGNADPPFLQKVEGHVGTRRRRADGLGLHAPLRPPPRRGRGFRASRGERHSRFPLGSFRPARDQLHGLSQRVPPPGPQRVGPAGHAGELPLGRHRRRRLGGGRGHGLEARCDLGPLRRPQPGRQGVGHRPFGQVRSGAFRLPAQGISRHRLQARRRPMPVLSFHGPGRGGEARIRRGRAHGVRAQMRELPPERNRARHDPRLRRGDAGQSQPRRRDPHLCRLSPRQGSREGREGVCRKTGRSFPEA